jgi:hypothetical protein
MKLWLVYKDPASRASNAKLIWVARDHAEHRASAAMTSVRARVRYQMAEQDLAYEMRRERLDVGICGWALNYTGHDNPALSQL